MIETTPEGIRYRNGQERSLASIIAEMKEELKAFIDTRVQMVKAELQETRNAAKIAVPLILVALALFATAFLLLTTAVRMGDGSLAAEGAGCDLAPRLSRSP